MKRAILLLAWCVCAYAARTTVTDTIYTLDGTVFTGTVSINAPAMVTAGGVYVAAWQKTITVTDGTFTLSMEPNDTAVPRGTAYTVRMFPKSGASTLEYWTVPTSGSPVTIGTIRTSQVPTPALTVALTQLSRTGGSKGCLIAFSTVWGPFCGGSNDQVLTKDSAQTYGVKWATPAAAATWGNITGTISNQTDLASALAAKAALSHAHTISDITATGTPSSSTYLRGDGAWATVSGTGNMSITSGAGAPSSNCTAGTSYFLDTTNHDIYGCSQTNTWQRLLATSGTGAFSLTGLNGTPCSTPASGSTCAEFNSTAKTLQTVDDAGVRKTLVKSLSCSTGEALTGINSDGTPVCTAVSGGSSAYWDMVQMDMGGCTGTGPTAYTNWGLDQTTIAHILLYCEGGNAAVLLRLSYDGSPPCCASVFYTVWTPVDRVDPSDVVVQLDGLIVDSGTSAGLSLKCGSNATVTQALTGPISAQSAATRVTFSNYSCPAATQVIVTLSWASGTGNVDLREQKKVPGFGAPNIRFRRSN